MIIDSIDSTDLQRCAYLEGFIVCQDQMDMGWNPYDRKDKDQRPLYLAWRKGYRDATKEKLNK